jgi:hypothetical protein
MVSTSKFGRGNTQSYFLNKQGQLVTIHTKNANENKLKSFRYNTEGYVVEEVVSDAYTAKSIESRLYTYEYYSDYQFKRFYLNSENLTYKYEVVDLDDQGRVVDSRARFIRGVNREHEKFIYSKNQLIEYSYNTKDVTRREEKFVMVYDEDGLLQITKKFVDAAPIYRFEYLYEKGLLIAILRKDLHTQEIQITKYRYTFY